MSAKTLRQTGKPLETEVANAYRKLGARKVEHDVEIVGNQIDVYVEFEASDKSLHRVAVEAKDWTATVGIHIVNGFGNIVDNLRRQNLIDEGVIVSNRGFSRQARNAAKTYGLRLLEPDDLTTMSSARQAAQRKAPNKRPVGQKRIEAWSKAQKIWTSDDFTADRGKVFARLDNLRQPWTPEDEAVGLKVCRKVDEFVRLAPYLGERRMLSVWGDPLAKAWVVLEPLVRNERDRTAWQTKWDAFEKLGTKALSARPHLQAKQREGNQAPSSCVQPRPLGGSSRNISGDTSMKWIVTFQRPSQGFSSERIIIWKFPFTLVDSSLIGAPEEWSRTSGYLISVSATLELVYAWEFGFVTSINDNEQVRNDRDNLMKVLFEYAKRYVNLKLKSSEPLAQEEKLTLNTSNAEVPCPYHYSRIQAPTNTSNVICEVETNPPANLPSGGVTINVDGDLNVSGDVIGRDKLTNSQPDKHP